MLDCWITETMEEEEILRTREEEEERLSMSGLRRERISGSVAREAKTGMMQGIELLNVSMTDSSCDSCFTHDRRQGRMLTQNARLLDTLMQGERELNLSKAMQNDL